MVDQALSSVTNFALGVLVARSVSVREFAGFSLAYVAYVLCNGLVSALVSEPLIVRVGTLDDDDRASKIKAAHGTAFVLSLAIAVVVGGAGLALPTPVGPALRILAVFLPGLLLQDVMRMTFFATGSPAKATANDGVWAFWQAALIVPMVAMGTTSVTRLIGAWGAAAGLAALFGLWQVRHLPSPNGTRSWLTGQRDLAVPFLGEFGLTTGAFQSTFYLLGLVGGLDLVAGLRGALMAANPLNILFLVVPPLAIPAAVRLR
ncbi:MAG TPA: hypothetical protein VFA94_08970, partial [Acidimicrobiales bacterium]|nr:hypothetical protein [Acidimicrobiales bacterium]